jgi:hypothetical protein
MPGLARTITAGSDNPSRTPTGRSDNPAYSRLSVERVPEEEIGR